jgi:hypothetical protein
MKGVGHKPYMDSFFPVLDVMTFTQQLSTFVEMSDVNKGDRRANSYSVTLSIW